MMWTLLWWCWLLFPADGECSDKHIDDGDQENAHNNVVVESVGVMMFWITSHVKPSFEYEAYSNSHLQKWYFLF